MTRPFLSRRLLARRVTEKGIPLRFKRRGANHSKKHVSFLLTAAPTPRPTSTYFLKSQNNFYSAAVSTSTALLPAQSSPDPPPPSARPSAHPTSKTPNPNCPPPVTQLTTYPAPPPAGRSTCADKSA